jgi:hypothetical protein
VDISLPLVGWIGGDFTPYRHRKQTAFPSHFGIMTYVGTVKLVDDVLKHLDAGIIPKNIYQRLMDS